MSTKLPWTRLFADKWLLDLAHLPSFEGFIYVKLRFQMLRTGEPLTNNFRVLSLLAGCSIKRFQKALDLLLETGHIICLEDGRLWNPDVELELNDSKEKSEAASKAAHSRWHKTKGKNDNNHVNETAYADCMQTACVSQCDRNAINNNINIYNKKNKTIVLSKKETEFEDLETTDLVYEPIECDDVDSQSELIETIETNQPPIHEQESVPKKAKRAKANRECRLPADFEPNLQYAIDQGLTHEEALLEFERFKLHWQDNPNRNAKKSDWQKAWYKWITHPEYGLLAKKKEKLEREKQYAKQRIEKTEQQRGWSYRVAQHMSNIKNSDSVYKFLFEDDNRTTIPLENGAKATDCRSGEGYFTSP
ncbi:DUF1376 domain-containing protein [Bartonella tribocorum]|uniref:Uncharacterized protein n=1 Tax=Bartonella tribocorum (strain DSM 28219 / CCUG 45778 / CIP 105476 / IBS 506) TaxID=382640 RepID=A9IT75_BART1|nr:DUF1376 domain-containing protein [Bartonella tribocorum]CAK01391.1 hypothetical protein BT_0995 [Bartonella tribocorum CIP 105476]CDO48617.1 phage related protein [Bartonella tribocorum]